MRLSYQHHLTKQQAVQRLEQFRPELLRRYGEEVSDLTVEWSDDVMKVSFHARGFKVSGTLTVTETDIHLDIGLPWLAWPFEGQVRERIVETLDGLFP